MRKMPCWHGFERFFMVCWPQNKIAQLPFGTTMFPLAGAFWGARVAYRLIAAPTWPHFSAKKFGKCAALFLIFVLFRFAVYTVEWIEEGNGCTYVVLLKEKSRKAFCLKALWG
ncbi:MAG: hypothetical protein QM642_07830 [Edaphocola sp.]